jgi:hypothetical protein
MSTEQDPSDKATAGLISFTTFCLSEIRQYEIEQKGGGPKISPEI